MNLTRNFWALMLTAVRDRFGRSSQGGRRPGAMLKDKVTISVGKKLVIRFEQDGNALSGPKVIDKAG